MGRKAALLLTVCGLLTVPALGASTAVASPGGTTTSASAPAGWERVDAAGVAKLAGETGSGTLAGEVMPIAVQSVRNGLYVAAEKNYAAPNTGLLRARTAMVDIWETFDLSPDVTGEKVSLNSHANGLYVSAELNYTGAAKGELRARSATATGSWEQFYLWYNADLDQYAFQSAANGLFVAMEYNYTGAMKYALRARSADIMGSWETFQIYDTAVPAPAAR
jgi:hypothetical protein